MEAAPPIPHHSQWQTSEEEEAPLLLSHPPSASAAAAPKTSTHDDHDDFEFCLSAGGGLLIPAAAAVAVEVDMCAADYVFQGQILPLHRSSVGSAPSWSVSWSDDSNPGGLCSSRSNSSSLRSSGCVIRSHSSGSTHSISALDASQLQLLPSLSNNFYVHPSPKPQLNLRGGGARLWPRATGQRSANSAPPGWGIFWLGFVQAPQIELHDLRSCRTGTSSGGWKSNADEAKSKKIGRSNDSPTLKRFEFYGIETKEDKKVARLVGRGLTCKSSSEVVEPSPWTLRKEEDVGESLRRVSSMCRNRILEWLEELTIMKVAPAGQPTRRGVNH